MNYTTYNIIFTRHALDKIKERAWLDPNLVMHLIKTNIKAITFVKPPFANRGGSVYFVKTSKGKFYFSAKINKKTKEIIITTFLGDAAYYNWCQRQNLSIKHKYISYRYI